MDINIKVGNTPMIKIKYEYNGKEKYIYTKLESYNMSGSIKDRIAYYMLKKAFTPVNSTSNILNQTIPGQIGWAPKQTVTGYHASNSKDLVPNYWFEGWAQKTHNAPH